MNYSRAIGYARFILAILCVVLMLSVAVFGFKLGKGNYINIPGIGNTRVISLGFDLTGGTVITYTADTKDTGETLENGMNKLQSTFRSRLDKMGLEDAECYLAGDKLIVIEISGVVSYADALNTFGTKGAVTFENNDKEVVMTREFIKSSSYYASSSNGVNTYYSIIIEFTEEGKNKFADITEIISKRSSSENTLSIKLDGAEISSSKITSRMEENYIVISSESGITETYARIVSATIAAGEFYYDIEASGLNPVAPAIGSASVPDILKIAIIALAIIMLIVIAIFKLSGLALTVSLSGYISLFILAMSFTYTRLTFSGLAAILLSVLLFISSNLIIFKKISEEITGGKSVRASIKNGYLSVRNILVNTHILVFITSAGLYITGSASIKSFAMVIGIGVVISFLTAMYFTKTLLKLLCDMNFKTYSIFSVKEGSAE